MRIGRTVIGLLLIAAVVAVLYATGTLGAVFPGAVPDAAPPAAAPSSASPPADAPAAPKPAPPATAGTPAIPSDAGTATVEYVHDGDTLFLTDGRKVRLLGIDTPEIGENAECFGREATDALRALLPEGTRVRTVADVNPEDRFGRSLLFLFLADGTLVNLELLREGYAETLIIAPNRLWTDELVAAEREAARADRGLWGAC